MQRQRSRAWPNSRPSADDAGGSEGTGDRAPPDSWVMFTTRSGCRARCLFLGHGHDEDHGDRERHQDEREWDPSWDIHNRGRCFWTCHRGCSRSISSGEGPAAPCGCWPVPRGRVSYGRQGVVILDRGSAGRCAHHATRVNHRFDKCTKNVYTLFISGPVKEDTCRS
jgi:hypothetical protein